MQAHRRLLAFGWGNSNDGQLGYGGDEPVTAPKRLDLLTDKRIRDIACGPRHTVCVDESGVVYSFGCNDHGQLGHNKRRTRPENVDALDAFEIVQVACGMGHTLALTVDGQLLSWGLGNRGQLGQGLEALSLTGANPKPKFIRELNKHKIVQIASGEAHCLALNDKGAVFAWGDSVHGQLGLGTFSTEHTPKRVMGLVGVPVTRIVCGGTHSIAISVSGDVYVWGNNQFGQIGCGNDSKKLRPTLLQSMHGKRVVEAAAGEAHTVLLTAEGRVYTFGASSNGQLGHDSLQQESYPKLLVDLMGTPSTLIACGRRHTAVYQAASQRLYVFGLNVSGQLGVGSTKSYSTPVVAKALNGAAIVALYCGGDQTFCLTEFDPALKSSSPEPTFAQPLSSLSLPISIPSSSTSGASDDMVLPSPPNISSSYNSILASSPMEVSYLTSTYNQTVRFLKPHEPSFLTLKKLQSLLEDSTRLGHVQHVIETTFTSAACLSGSFLDESTHWDVSKASAGIKNDDVRAAYSLILGNSILATTLGNVTAKLVKNLESFEANEPETARVYLLLLLNPLLLSPNIFHIVIQKVVTLILGVKSETRDVLTSWFAKLETSDFARIVQVFQSFLSFLLSQQQLTLDNSITSCAMALDWLNKINNAHSIVPIKTFFNADVSTKVDIIADYHTWVDNPNLFSFCRYPFLLDTETKMRVLHVDSALSMQGQMTQALYDTLTHKQDTSPILHIKISRNEDIVRTTFAQLAAKHPVDYLKPLIVQFEGEEGQDEGGVRKEFFFLLFQVLLDPEFGMFTYDEQTRMLWFNPFSTASALDYLLVGALLGLAVYNDVLVDVNFPPVLYKKLLGMEAGLDDLQDWQPSIYNSLKAVKQYDGLDLADVFNLTFSIDMAGPNKEIITHDLKKNGADQNVTIYNKSEFVDRYVKFITTEQIEQQYAPFAQGFRYVISKRILNMFHPTEVESIIRGSQSIHFHDLEQAAEYGNGYTSSSPTIRQFWQVFHSFDTELKRKFLLFLTGSDRVPLQGFKNLKFLIQRTGDVQSLPVAHTCYNILDLPDYNNISDLQSKLVYAITNTVGFGLI